VSACAPRTPSDADGGRHSPDAGRRSSSCRTLTARYISRLRKAIVDVNAALASLSSGSVPATRTINTTAPLTGGGDLSADRTLAMPFATGFGAGYLLASDWNTFNGKEPAIASPTLPTTKWWRGDKTFNVLAMADISNLPVLASGTYTPTLSNTTNIAASAAFVCQYQRVGNVVTVSGRVNITPTAASVASELGISLPIASTGLSGTLDGVAGAAARIGRRTAPRSWPQSLPAPRGSPGTTTPTSRCAAGRSTSLTGWRKGGIPQARGREHWRHSQPAETRAMTVSAATARAVTIAAAGATTFPFGFKIIADADLLVTVNNVVKTLGVDYLVAGAGNLAGGSALFQYSMAGGETVVLKRNMAYKRDVDFQLDGDLHSDTLNNDQDAPVMMLQQLAADVALGLRLADANAALGRTQLAPIVPLAPLVGSADGLGLEFGSGTLSADLLLRANLADGDTAGRGPNLIAYKDDGTGSIARTLDARLRDRIELDVLSFIPAAQHAAIRAGTSTFDSGPYVQAGIDALAVLGGGSLMFPKGGVRTRQQIKVTTNAIWLRGRGGGFQSVGQAATRASALSRLEWDPTLTPVAGTAVVSFAIPAGASGRVGGGIVDLMIDGNTVCPIGLNLVSWTSARFDRCSFYACTADQVLLETSQLALVQTVGATQYNRFTQCYMGVNGGSGWYLTTTANGLRLKGGSLLNSGDSSINHFHALRDARVDGLADRHRELRAGHL
jgi:hypothetical protein